MLEIVLVNKWIMGKSNLMSEVISLKVYSRLTFMFQIIKKLCLLYHIMILCIRTSNPWKNVCHSLIAGYLMIYLLVWVEINV